MPPSFVRHQNEPQERKATSNSYIYALFMVAKTHAACHLSTCNPEVFVRFYGLPMHLSYTKTNIKAGHTALSRVCLNTHFIPRDKTTNVIKLFLKTWQKVRAQDFQQ